MPENESTNESGYSEPFQENVRRMTLEAFEEHENGWLRRLIDYRCERMVLALFEEALERGQKKCLYTCLQGYGTDRRQCFLHWRSR